MWTLDSGATVLEAGHWMSLLLIGFHRNYLLGKFQLNIWVQIIRTINVIISQKASYWHPLWFFFYELTFELLIENIIDYFSVVARRSPHFPVCCLQYIETRERLLVAADSTTALMAKTHLKKRKAHPLSSPPNSHPLRWPAIQFVSRLQSSLLPKIHPSKGMCLTF